jgi:parallel beta-helix repeat protein
MKKERSLIFVSILVILLFAVFTPASLQADNQTPFANNESILDATITSTVYVHNDAELQALAVDGTGTPVDPWIIRDLVIDTTDILGLRIDDTTEHFEILNCTITAGWGIYLDNIADSTARIKNNTVINCNSYGIYLNKANGTWIEENNLIDNSRGIVINYCYLTFILENYCSNDDAGIFIRDSPYASLTNNVLVGDGIEFDFDNLEDMLTVASSGDTVNGKPFILSKSVTGSSYTGDFGQIIVINGSSVSIHNQEIIDVDIGIAVYYSDLIHIDSSTFSESDSGIYLVESTNCIVFDCLFYDMSDGIHIDNCNYTTIRNNNFDNCWDGIFANYPYDLRIFENNFHSNPDAAIYLDTCTIGTIYQNNFTTNGDLSGYQAYDYDGTYVYFYDPINLIGNYWSDYDPSDDNYTVAGNPVNYDLYPLTEPIILVPEFNMSQLGFWGLIISIMTLFVVLNRIRKRKS